MLKLNLPVPAPMNVLVLLGWTAHEQPIVRICTSSGWGSSGVNYLCLYYLLFRLIFKLYFNLNLIRLKLIFLLDIFAEG